MDVSTLILRFRNGRQGLLGFAQSLFFCITTAVYGQHIDTLPAALVEDANLNDLFFQDDKLGWTVGDRGAVFQTDNGGQVWQRLPFPTTDRLCAVYFHDALNGWIGTSWTEPYLHTPRGQIWRTMDGGMTWHASKIDTLADVRSLFFVDDHQGWATTGPSDLHGGSLFHSRDGGRSWQAIYNTAQHDWIDTAWRDDGSGVCITTNRQVVFLPVDKRRRHPRGVAPIAMDAAVRPRAITTAMNRTLICGDGGMLLALEDNGRGWQDLRAGLPGGMAGEFDWLTVTSRGNHVWMAGEPGTTVLQSSDGGRTWSVSRTRHVLPIHRLRFVDALHGWAVGAQGMILATGDGGVTWQPQRSVANRVAVLGIYADAEDIDYELLTHLSVEEGYRSQVLLAVDGASTSGGGERRVEARAHEAAVMAGSGGAKCPGSTRNGEAALQQHLVRSLRMWRPDLVVTAGDADDARRLRTAIVAGIQQAAQERAFRTQLSIAGLPSWQVRKAFLRQETDPANHTGRVSGPVLTTAQLVLPLRRSLGDVGAGCRALFAAGYDPPPATVAYRSLLAGDSSRQIMAGVMSPRGSSARRPALTTAVSNVRDLSLSFQRRRMAELLFTQHVKAGEELGVLLGQLDDLIAGMGTEAAGDTVFQLAEMLSAHDRSDAARALRQLFLERFATHPARDAVVWRQLQAAISAEYQLWQAGQAPRAAEAIRARANSAADGPTAGHVTPAALIMDQTDGTTPDMQRLLRAASPLLASRPEVRWALAVAAGKDPGELISQHADADDEWRRRGMAEAKLSEPAATAPSVLWKCSRRGAPHLDGTLDDSTWQDVPRIALQPLRAEQDGNSHQDENRASLAAAYDERFFYLTISCPKVATAAYPSAGPSRQRDTDLSAFDRLELSIDVDRDAMSSWQLTVDSRGWANDACLTHESWNPTWHIAVQQSAAAWIVEAAIPLDELTSESVTTGAAWAVAVRRHIPGSGTEAWPATVHEPATPQSFGLLVFE